MPPELAPEVEQLIVTRERLRLLALGYYVKGAVCVLFVSLFLFHLVFLLGISFMPQSAWNEPAKPASTQSPATLPLLSSTPTPAPVNQALPVMMFRIFALALGVIILLGWTFGGLTIYAGRCVQERKHRVFIYVMAGLNCVLLPWGTLLGVSTLIVMQSPMARAEFLRLENL
jgi:uncharacterized membrane-anchored protein YitT (DUF2179 family)